MDYLHELRSKIGHMPIMYPAASVIAVDENGRILLQRRVDNGKWSYCGGGIELYEKTDDAARRELYEETGLIADELELFGVFSGEELHYIYPNGDEVSVVDILYICRKWHGELKCQPEEVSELRFFDIDSIPAEISPPTRMPLNEYISRHKAGFV
ncbi:MAG: NUDIX hydrolase [Huintestinicola sp.]